MVGRPVGVVTVEVVVLVPAPALRRAVRGREGAVVVVVVVTGRVQVEVTGRGRLEMVVGRVRVDVVVGAVVIGGGAVVVIGGAVPVPATGGSMNAFRASSTLTGKDRLKSSISWSNWVRSTGRVSSVTISVMVLISWEGGGGAVGEPTPAGERVGGSIRADKSVCCPPSLRRRTLVSSRCSSLSNGRDIRPQGVHLRLAFSRR